MEQKDAEKLYELELEKAKASVESWLNSESEDELIQTIMDESDLKKEEVQASITSTIQVATDALAKIHVYSAELKKST